MESREERIVKLASTLRASGIAKSDSQARMMAEDMIGVEEHVQKSYEEEHSKAQEYLQTVKNLGTPRPVAQKPVEQKQEIKQEVKTVIKAPPRQLDDLYVSKLDSNKQPPAPEYTSTNFGTKTLNQAFDHDTHNSALEAIKAEISRKEFKSVDDIVPDSVVPQSMLHEDIEVVHEVDVPVELKSPSESNVPLHEDIEIIHESVPVSDVLVESVELVSAESDESKPVEEESASEELSASEQEQDAPEQSASEQDAPEQPASEQKLDAQKLIDMMEEDGKLEEHTREIKEKPTNVKPKEAYEENNIDLSNMFDFNKGVVRK